MVVEEEEEDWIIAEDGCNPRWINIRSRHWIPMFLCPSITLWILAWAGGESLISFYGLNWGIGRSNRAFFTLFVGGSLIRLVSLGVVAYIVTVLGVPPAAPLLSLVLAYFILSLVQLPFLTHELR